MSATRRRWARAYGASGWHLTLMFASLVLVAYVLAVVGLSALWNSEVRWQSIAVWFVAAVIFHDLVLSRYALADRVLSGRCFCCRPQEAAFGSDDQFRACRPCSPRSRPCCSSPASCSTGPKPSLQPPA